VAEVDLNQYLLTTPRYSKRMNREQWLLQLKEGTGIFDATTIKTLQADAEMIALAREIIRLPWVKNPEDEFLRLETSAIAYLVLVKASEAVHELIAAELEAERIGHAWIPEIVPQAIGAFGPVGFDAALARILELERDTGTLVSLEGNLYWHYWSMVIGLGDVASEFPAFEPAFVDLTKQRLEQSDFPDQLTELWVGSVQAFKSSSSLEALIKVLFDKNQHTAKRGFSEWLETREQNLALTLPLSRQFAEDLLLEIRAEYLEQIQLGHVQTKDARFVE
jgi:hypothetical protein